MFTDMELKDVLAVKLPAIKRSVALGISADEDAKKAGNQVKHNVVFVYEGWTIGDLVDRLMVASSPKVTFENKYRGKEVPKTWDVNKAYAKGEVSIESLWAAMSDADRAAFLEKYNK